jgi:hypothetical protein
MRILGCCFLEKKHGISKNIKKKSRCEGDRRWDHTMDTRMKRIGKGKDE